MSQSGMTVFTTCACDSLFPLPQFFVKVNSVHNNRLLLHYIFDDAHVVQVELNVKS